MMDVNTNVGVETRMLWPICKRQHFFFLTFAFYHFLFCISTSLGRFSTKNRGVGGEQWNILSMDFLSNLDPIDKFFL